jgi:hypothetical protein
VGWPAIGAAEGEESPSLRKAAAVASLGLPHWLMIAGALLVMAGFIGFALSRNKAVEIDPGPLPDERAEPRPQIPPLPTLRRTRDPRFEAEGSSVSRGSISALDQGEESGVGGDEAADGGHMVESPQITTVGEMRSGGVRGVIVHCRQCAYVETVSADEWPSGVRLSDLEPRFVCQACGKRGADIRPDWQSEH